MCKDLPPLERAIQFHGHICPGLLLGVRAAELALHHLGVAPAADEELLAIVETDSCGVDAIQAILGCTVGKGNLIMKDYGKNVYTIASRASGRAVRIAQRYQARSSPEAARYRELARQPALTDAEAAEKEVLLGVIFERLMTQPEEELFAWREVELALPERAGVFPTVQCIHCGEGVMEPRAAKTEAGWCCPDCRARKG